MASALVGCAPVSASAVRFASSPSLLSPLSVDSDQATATGTASGHTHKQKARSTTYSGVAARMHLGHERGRSLLHLAQLQTTTPKHARRRQQLRSRGCWLENIDGSHSQLESNASYQQQQQQPQRRASM
jgi:hypothetical protein